MQPPNSDHPLIPNQSKISSRTSTEEDVYLTVNSKYQSTLTVPNIGLMNRGQRRTSSLPELGKIIHRLLPSSLSWSKHTSGHLHGSERSGTRSILDEHNDTHHKADSSPPIRRRLRNRLLQQDGHYNISMTHVHHSIRNFYSDMWTTLIEVKWRWALLVFALSFIMSWLAFSVIYYCIMHAHGDFEDHKNEDWKSCIVSVHTFAAVFMFSLETQTTIGYGHRYPSDECPEVTYTVCLQSMFGVVIQTLLVGVVFAKLIRPKHRAHTIQFSRCGVISLRERRLCFMFRVGDLRKTHLASIDLRVFMIRKHVTPEGEILPFYIREMKCKVGDVDGCPLLTWPVVVCHTIDQYSPLYEISQSDLITAKFEIHVILDGVTPTNGMSTTARTSYLPTEIHWGCRLDGLITYQTEQGEYRIDYSKFHAMHPMWTPVCSAKKMDEIFQTGINPATWFEEMQNRESDAMTIDAPHDHINCNDQNKPRFY